VPVLTAYENIEYPLIMVQKQRVAVARALVSNANSPDQATTCLGW
jgi:ABC-type methionine transport system ATPase subunit